MENQLLEHGRRGEMQHSEKQRSQLHIRQHLCPPAQTSVQFAGKARQGFVCWVDVWWKCRVVKVYEV